MAYQHGTANGTVDLWNKLIAFLTTDASLVAANENWDILWTAPSGQQKDGIVLRGPGASGNDQILIGLRRVDAAAADEQQIFVRGMTGIIGSAPSIDDHVNMSSTVGGFFDSGQMEYWMVASGRRFVLIAKMSTVYVALYGGFFLPYASPLSYPYPLMVGGSMSLWRNALTRSDRVLDWRTQSDWHTHFPYSRHANISTSIPEVDRSTCAYLDVAGAWKPAFAETFGQNNGRTLVAPYSFDPLDDSLVDSWPYMWNTSATWGDVPNYTEMVARMEENVGGGFALKPFTLAASQPVVETIGIMDGCYNVPGQNNAVENIVQIEGIDYLVMQNVFRTEVREYWALRLS